jgi:DnaA-homolog protein
MAVMKQLPLDIGLTASPSFGSFFPGPNQSVFEHLLLWFGSADQSNFRSPVPTYLWGQIASGKTHLLKAVQAALGEQGGVVGWLDPTVRQAPDFNPNWTAVLMDDVHQYSAIQQQIAFNWFVNAISPDTGFAKPVLAAGDLPPAQLLLRDDLRTRLGWGHVFKLEALTEPERRAVLRKEADSRGIFLSDDVMDYVMSRFSRDLGSLMHLLDQLDQFALQSQRGITIPLIKAMLDTS